MVFAVMEEQGCQKRWSKGRGLKYEEFSTRPITVLKHWEYWGGQMRVLKPLELTAGTARVKSRELVRLAAGTYGESRILM